MLSRVLLPKLIFAALLLSQNTFSVGWQQNPTSNWVEIVQSATRSIVVIETDKAQGSGFFVSGNGTFVTNQHVVKDAKTITVKLNSGETYQRAYLLAVDDQRDLALLRIEGSDLPPLPLGNSNDSKAGEEVLLIGAPRGLEQTVSSGIISGIRVLNDGNKVIQTTAPASPGSSGGPLINREGRVIGVLSFTLTASQNLNFTIPINYAKGMLDALPLSSGLPITVLDSTKSPVVSGPVPVAPPTAASNTPLPDALSLGAIWFYRTKSATDSVLNPTIYENGVPLAKLEKGQYFGIAVQPGTHYFSWTDRPKFTERASVTVRGGEQAFFHVRWRSIAPVDSATWRQETMNLRPIEGKNIFNAGVLRANDPRLPSIKK